MEAIKVCTKCKRGLPAVAFYKRKRGLGTWCRECEITAVRNRQAENRSVNEDDRYYSVQWMRTKKTCPMCNEEKMRYDFHRKKTSSDGCGSRCKDCISRSTPKQRTNQWRALRTSALHRSKVFTISECEYNQLISIAACHYCGGALPKKGGLDRLDNSRGYEPGNVVPCCRVCNMIRGDHFTYEEMLELAPKIREIFAKRRITQQPACEIQAHDQPVGDHIPCTCNDGG